MEKESRNSGMRTVDIARRVGCSVQQVRNLERDGVLPPAERSASGYRRYTQVHVRCGSAYRLLAIGVGPVEAKKLLRAAQAEPTSQLLELLDEAHARLHAERRDLELTRQAVEMISTEPSAPPRPSDAMTISEVAGALGVPPSTLRHWEAEALLTPQRAARCCSGPGLPRRKFPLRCRLSVQRGATAPSINSTVAQGASTSITNLW